MRKIFLGIFSVLMVTIMFSCGVSTSDIEKETKKLMVEKFKENGQSLLVKDFTLIHESGNNYKGLADCTLDGEKIQLDVSVLCDGTNIKAEWEPTAEYQQKMIEEAFDEMMEEAFEEMPAE